jgi:hypothetical protein
VRTLNSSRKRSMMTRTGDEHMEIEVLSATARAWSLIVQHWDDVTALIGLVLVIRWLVVK